jgi:Pro-kumamolisin, activation domain/Bacterial Ig-like domain (group 3)
MRPLRRLLVLLCFGMLVSLLARETAGQTTLPQPRIVAAVDEAQLAVLKGNTHPLALAQYDRGAAPADLPMNRMLLVLKRSPEQEAALSKLLDDQQDKSSPSYHRWLTPDEFGRQFGPADQDMQVITSWIASHGFEINNVSKGRTVMEFSGSAAQVQEAFHTSIHKFTVKGEDHWANASDPQIPAALTPVVAGVHTLHNFYKKPQIHLSEQKIAAKFLPGAPGKPPQVTFPGSPSFHALGPADYSKIYNISPLYTGIGSGSGNGILIGVVGRSNLFQGGSDVNSFVNVFQFPSPTFSVLLNGPDPGDLGGEEEAEATLDSTWSAAIAPPNAFVNLVVSASTNTTDGVDLSELFLIDHNQWEVITESFGGCEANVTAAEATGTSQLAEEAAAQGITYVVSSDDSGAEGCDSPTSVAKGPLSVNVLASTPFTVAVGGTTFDENGSNLTYWSASNGTGFESALSYIPEDVWNESCSAAKCGNDVTLWASGGGVSTYFPKPSWQSGVAGIPTDGFRDVPDVALSAASHDPYLLCLEGSCVPDAQGNIEFATVSGTSAAAPSFAGIIALLNTALSAPREGQVDYVLYRLAAAETFSQCNASSHAALPASSCIFNDVTSGNNAVPGETGYGTPSAPYQSGVGYDLATGLGSVNVANLAKAWSSVTFNPTATTLSLGPTANITHGSSVTVNATVAPNTAGGTPTGDVFLLAFTYGGATPISVGLFPLEGGSVSSTTNALPGGTHAVTARYGGDGTFAPSTSSPLTVTILPEPSSTVASAFTTDQNGHLIPFLTGPYGSFVYLRADVSGESGAGTPTGGIYFQDTGGQNLGSSFSSLNSEGNTATPNGVFNLASGPHAITAAYTGDASFNPSTSSPLNLTITLASTATTMTSSLNSQASGATLAAAIATNSGGAPPTGTVTFSAGGNALGSVPVTGSANAQTGTAQATANFIDTQLANGQYAITATYNGDSNYVASSSAASTINLQPDFTLSLNANQLTATTPGTLVSLELTVAALDGFNGTISFAATSCAGLPAESSCSFSPASIAGSGSTQVAVMTSGPHPAAARGLAVAKDFAWWTTGFGVSLSCVCLMGSAPKKRRWGALLSLLALAFLLALPNCGGGSSSSGSGSGGAQIDPGTPTGAYPVTVTATSGNLSHTTSFTLVVQ